MAGRATRGPAFAAGLAAALMLALSSPASAQDPRARPPDLVLITLDTTRADHLGCYGAAGANTPVLDALAARGVRYARALTPVPLTLPAHASLLTGLDPPEHGVRDNGVAVLPGELPTLAALAAGRGYSTAAFVASRVLDRRFGLDRGFAVYDDAMPAEQIGEYGYPERDAAQVTDAAIAWAAKLPAGRPYLVWVHYYDPHSPYAPPREFWAESDEGRYAGEIAYVDREIGRLLAALPGQAARRVVAVVGDHGEALGEHGERAHGILLYRAALEVPLIVVGPGVPAGRVVEGTVSIRRLAPTLLSLAGLAREATTLGRPLSGLGAKGDVGPYEPVYGETRMPATVFGWSSLTALSDDRWRLIVAPRPELYDFVADPAESVNLLAEKTEVARRLKRALTELERSWTVREADAPLPDAQLEQALRSLGYLGGARSARGGAIDPKDGIEMLSEFDRAKELLGGGRAADAAAILRDLVRRSPGNLPFLTNLGSAELRSGRGEQAVATYRRAIELNPGLDFPHLQLAAAYLALGRPAEARREYELVLGLNPRSAAAWLQLAELAGEGEGGRAEAIRLLRRAVASGTESAAVFTRLGELEMAAGDRAAADRDLKEAIRVAPRWAPAWALWGDLAAAAGRLDDAFDRYFKASQADPYDPAIFLRLGLLEISRDRPATARQFLQQILAVAAPDSPAAREARRLLAELR